MGRRPGEPPFLQGKVGYRIAPSSDPASPAHLPPKGKALGREEPSVADFRPSQGPEQNPICFLHGHKVNWPKAKRGWPGPCAGQKTLLTPRVPALLARFGVQSPNFGSPAQRVPKFPPPYSPFSTTVRPQGRPWPSQSRRQQVVVISSLR